MYLLTRPTPKIWIDYVHIYSTSICQQMDTGHLRDSIELQGYALYGNGLCTTLCNLASYIFKAYGVDIIDRR